MHHCPKQISFGFGRRFSGLLEKYPKKVRRIDPSTPQFQDGCSKFKPPHNFGITITVLGKTLFPKPLHSEFYKNIFVDADHVHDKMTGGYISGSLSMVGCNPLLGWLTFLWDQCTKSGKINSKPHSSVSGSQLRSNAAVNWACTVFLLFCNVWK